MDKARQRISMIFDNFNDIIVSISSGKDSTVLFFLCIQEARKRDRKITAFFLDQEAEYQSSIDLIEKLMTLPEVNPKWFQVPIFMTNATSMNDFFLYAWGEGEKWIREKHKIAIHKIEKEYPKRFYPFFEWYEKETSDSAHLIGLRAEEGITRFRAVTKFKGWKGLRWSTEINNIVRFYPIYDWSVYDIWKFIYDFNLPYNKIYDLMFWDNYGIYQKMRVSNLIHEKSFKCLSDLPKFEPETYNKLCKRISGIQTATRYATEKLVFDNKILPSHYNTWKEFRDFLLENIEHPTHKKRFKERFSKQKRDEKTYQAQVGQLLINDYENSKKFDTKKQEKREKVKEKWMKIL
ncbi:MAG: phosphoadenosine phosphosulfate reductase family protein [Candidatus Thorarchaeota archaeon]